MGQRNLLFAGQRRFRFQGVPDPAQILERLLYPAQGVEQDQAGAQGGLDQRKLPQGKRPFPGAADVIDIGGQPGEGFALRGASQGAILTAQELHKVPAVTGQRFLLYAGVPGQVLGSVLPDQLVQIVPAGPAAPDQRFGHQRGKQGQRGSGNLPGRLA